MNDRPDELTPRLFDMPKDPRATSPEDLGLSEAARTRNKSDRFDRRYRVAGNPLEALKVVLATTNSKQS